jgi:hypothetical protein
MCSHIAKLLQSCCKAIQNAVQAYNTAALALSPARLTLDWSKVSHYAFLEEFNILHDTRNDIREKKWANLAIREMLKQHQKLKRAEEEIHHCNIEVWRLHTSIIDEEQKFTAILLELQDAGGQMYSAVHDYVARRFQVNTQLLKCINQIYLLKGFTGITSPGIRKGTVLLDTQDGGRNEGQEERPPTPIDLTLLIQDDDQKFDPASLEDDNDLAEKMNGLVDYISQLSVNMSVNIFLLCSLLSFYKSEGKTREKHWSETHGQSIQSPLCLMFNLVFSLPLLLLPSL